MRLRYPVSPHALSQLQLASEQHGYWLDAWQQQYALCLRHCLQPPLPGSDDERRRGGLLLARQAALYYDGLALCARYEQFSHHCQPAPSALSAWWWRWRQQSYQCWQACLLHTMRALCHRPSPTARQST